MRGRYSWLYLVIASCVFFGNGWKETRAFLDGLGRIHWGGEIFEQESSDGEVIADSLTCEAGMSIPVSYGGSQSIAVLEVPLRSGDQSLLACNEVFLNESWGGPIVLHCNSGSLVAEMHCGCARHFVIPPNDCRGRKAAGKSAGSPSKSCNVKGKQPRDIHRVDRLGAVWPHAEVLEEGYTEWRDCAEFPAGHPSEEWSFRCSDGQLELSTDRCRCGFDSTSRRLNEAASWMPACNPPPNDTWWPRICDTLTNFTVTTLAGAQGVGNSSRQFNIPRGLAMDLEGYTIVADQANNRLQLWSELEWSNEQGGETIIGDPTGNNGTYYDTDKLNKPVDVSISGCRDAYVADRDNHRIVLYRPGYPDLIILVGSASNGPAENQLNFPSGVYVQSYNQHIYIADTMNQRVTHYSPVPPHGDYAYRRTVLGVVGVVGSSSTLLNNPGDIYVDRLENMFIADTGNNRILRVTQNQAGIGSTVVGTCNTPTGVHVDNALNVYVACKGDHCIKRWDWLSTSNSYVGPATAAGECGIEIISPPGAPGNATYLATLTRLYEPEAVFVDSYGSLLVSDTGNNRILKVGRPALIQWILRNAESLEAGFEFDYLGFYTDLECTQQAVARDFISSNTAGSLANWSASCLGGCAKYTQWVGNVFYNESGIRCIRTALKYDTNIITGGMALNVAYWNGLDFDNYYEFGGILPNTNVSLRLPRFVPYNTSCVKGGQLCVLSDVLGDWQNDNDKIMVKMGNCLTGDYVPGFPNGGISNPYRDSKYTIGIESQSTVVSWLSADAMGIANYKICWCDSQLPGITFSCQVPGDFTEILVGYVLVVGPFDDQEFFVFRGQFLVVESLQGVDMGQGDMLIAISGQCGPISNTVVGLISSDGVYSPSQESLDGAYYSWGTESAAVPVPGRYTLCWCRSTTSNACGSQRDFRALAGVLLVKGPQTGQNFVCISGFPCHITVIAEQGDLEAGDSVDAQATGCGLSEVLISGFPQKFAYNNENVNVSNYSWGSTRVTASVGLYFMCWCAAATNCTSSEEHRADIGLLSIHGPDVRGVLCTLGRPCEIGRVTGVGLGNGDRIMVTTGSHFKPGVTFNSIRDSILGTSDPNLLPTPTHDCTLGVTALAGFPPASSPGISNKATGRGKEFYWGEVQYTQVNAGIYRMCWCHRTNDCQNTNNFRTEMGMLTVAGPFQVEENYVCGAGKTCVVDIDAVEPLDADKMIVTKGTGVLGGCGLGNELAVNEFDAQGSPIGTHLTVSEAWSTASTVLGRQQHRWGPKSIPNGGEALICWCAIDCNSVASFNVKVGTVGITAPTENSVDESCESSLPCTIRVKGIGLLATNKLAMVDGECGAQGIFATDIPNSATSLNTTVLDSIYKNVSDFVFGTPDLPIRAAGAIFTACWCSDGCSVITEFIINVGRITIVAPFLMTGFKTCWQGLQCNVSNIDGYGLTDANKLQIITLCGDDSSSEGGVPNRGISLVTSQQGTRYGWGSTVITAQPQEFELCWCSGVEDCDQPQHFVTKIGILKVGGPYAGQFRFCFVGQECSILELKGIAMRRLDTIVLLETWCGQGKFLSGAPPLPWESAPCTDSEGNLNREWQNISNTSIYDQAALETDYSCMSFFVPTVVYSMELMPQMYRMCWCSIISDYCDQPEDFTVDVGLMTLAGPSVGQVHLCFAGFNCTLHNVLGVSLGVGDFWMVKRQGENCSDHHNISNFPNGGRSEPATNIGKVVTWSGPVDAAIAPGEYMVCWCPGHADARDAGIDCSSWNQFNAEGGFLKIVGPTPLSDLQTCAVGSKCKISNVAGVELQNGDRILVIEGTPPSTMCGSSNARLVAGFSNNGLSDGATLGGTEFTWTPELEKTLKGGTYSLCWCAASRRNDPNVQDLLSCYTQNGNTLLPKIEEFTVFIGMITIPGTPLNDLEATCISGLSCKVTGVSGVSDAPLVDGAQIEVLEVITSSIPNSIPLGSDEFKSQFCLPSSSGWKSRVWIDGSSASSAVSDGARDGGATYTWENEAPIRSVGGVYHMCWRAPPPPETFEFYVGTLTIVGPDAVSTNGGVCTRSLTCVISGIKGTGLSDQDFVRILGQDCAKSSVNMAVQNMHSRNEIIWEGFDFDLPVGRYTICWCYYTRDCAKEDDYTSEFSTPLGLLSVRGPIAGQNRVCGRGHACVVDQIAGVEMKTGDKAEVHVECGQGPRVVGFTTTNHNEEDAFETASATVSPVKAATYLFRWVDLRAKPGIYRICYCAENECLGNGPFLTSDFVNEIGIITVQGPADLDQAASVMPEEPLWGRMWTVTLKGLRLHLMAGARLRLMWKCGLCQVTNQNHEPKSIAETPLALAQPNTLGTEFVFDAGNMSLLSVTKDYCLCWCQDYCDTLKNFTLDIGRVTIYCPAGEEPTVYSLDDIVCTYCAIGRYKPEFTNVLCSNCSDPNHITSHVGAMMEAQCICMPGTYAATGSGGACGDCLENHYCEGGFQAPACMQYNFCPIDCGTGAQQKATDKPHLCPEETNCLINYDSYCFHERAKPCPSGSGAWFNCDSCTGAYPAWNASSCSCQEGYAPHGQVCKKCELGYVKANRGNQSCSECSETLSGSTTDAIGSTECGCGRGFFMQLDANNQPLLCSPCPVGFYCPGFTERVACPENKTTEAPEAESVSECKCAPGYFQNTANLCTPCLAGGIFYKDDIGDHQCTKQCPANSQIPTNYVGGPRGVESCACFSGFTQDIIESSGQMECVQSNVSTDVIQSSTRVPSVKAQIVLSKVKPITVNEQNDFLRQVIASQLGLADFERVEVRIVSYTNDPPPQRRLQQLNTSLSTTTSPSPSPSPSTSPSPSLSSTTLVFSPSPSPSPSVSFADLPPMYVTVEVIIWQPTYIQAKEIFDESLDPNNVQNKGDITLEKIQEVVSLGEAFKGVENITFNRFPTSTAPEGSKSAGMEYITLTCEPNTGIVPETIFESIDTSCQCMPGFEPQSLAQKPVPGWPNTSKCSPCVSDPHSPTGASQGRYKEKVGDFPCRFCRFWKVNGDGTASGYTSTVPFIQDGINVSISESQCACLFGYYRSGDLCFQCPPGHYCPGDTLYDPTPCPPNTWTLPSEPLTDNDDISDCHCERGYFLAFDTQECEMCDPGYYKDDISNGPGRCTQRCSFTYGFRSTSAEGKAATSLGDCYCQPGSFLRNDSVSSTCEACPAEGVECLGGFENSTDPNATVKIHRKPTTIEEFWMIDVSIGSATQCRTKGVCLKNNECLEGQKDFICGACSEGWTRDNFQSVCRDCSKFPGSSFLVFQILLDLTMMVGWNGFLTMSSVSKTEAQRNILTVLLRMYTHWSSQVSVLFNFDLSSLTSLYGDTESESDTSEAAAAAAAASSNSSNTTAAVEEESGLPWPSWQKEITESLMAFADIVPSIGSTQEVLECLVDRHWSDPSGVRKHYWKLMIPALWWFMYPVVMVLWVIMFGWLGSRIGVGGFLVITGERTLMTAIGMPMWLQAHINNTFFAPKGNKRGEKGHDEDSDSQGSSEESEDMFSEDDSVDMNAIRYSSENVDGELGSTKKKDDPGYRDWQSFATTMNQLVVLPNRFSLSQGLVHKAAEPKGPADDDDGTQERILVFFRPDTTFKQLVTDDIAPWIVVTLNNVWVPVTGRVLQMLYCENFPEGNVRLMMNTMVVCWVSQEHQHLLFVGMSGLIVWSIGIVMIMYAIIKKHERAHDLQNPTIQRTFGYLLEGYEPKCWNWELTVKKMDLLATSLITYTSLASDTRAKVLLYAVLASIAVTFQISYTPYDNRSGNLLDSVENFGLGARFLMFWGVAICLLFNTTKIETALVAAVVVTCCALFLFQLFLYGIDDWAKSQYQVNLGRIILKKKELLRKRQKNEAESSKTIVVSSGKDKKLDKTTDEKKSKKKKKDDDSVAASLLKLFMTVKSILRFVRSLFNADYRAKQQVCFDWCGPTSDAVLHKPNPTDGMIKEEDKATMGELMKFIAEMRGHLNRSVWHLDSESQIDFAVESIQNFTYHVIVSAKFGQLPARLTDLMMLLAASIKSLRWELINNPNPKVKKTKKKDKPGKDEPPIWAAPGVLVGRHGEKGRLVQAKGSWKVQWDSVNQSETEQPPAVEVKSWKGMKKLGEAEAKEVNIEEFVEDDAEEMAPEAESDDEVEDKGKMQQLKAMILRDVFDRLWAEQHHRKEILQELKPKLTIMLKERSIPEELAWEVLDRMNTSQIEATRASPTQVLLRIRFFEFLLQCDCSDQSAARQRIQDLQINEEKERSEVMTFLQFMLRSDFENRTMPWSHATHIFDRLPVEELRHLANDRERCLEMLDSIEEYENQPKKNIQDDAVTVEDLNHMLMYLQKFTYHELHEIIEYTQMLLDFLQLPSSDIWCNHFVGHAYSLEEGDEDLDEGERSALRDIRDRDPEIFDSSQDAADLEFLAHVLQGDLRGNDLSDPPSRGSYTSSTMTPTSGSGNTPEIVLRGRHIPEPGNKLPTVTEERTTSVPMKKNFGGEQFPPRQSRRAAGRLPTARCIGGVGLAASGKLQDVDALGSNHCDEDERSWDSDDDDPKVNLGELPLDISEIEVDDRNSLIDDIHVDLDNHDLDHDMPKLDVLSIGTSDQSDITELTGFSSIGSARGRGNVLMSPPRSASRIANVPASLPREKGSKSGSNTSTSGSIASESAVEASRAINPRSLKKSANDEISRLRACLEDD